MITCTWKESKQIKYNSLEEPVEGHEASLEHVFFSQKLRQVLATSLQKGYPYFIHSQEKH